MKVEMRYNPLGGVLGATITKLFGKEPGQHVHDDLHPSKR
jgi:uncharacterized membrane protein